MMRSRQILFLFLPALFIAAFALFIQVLKYEPLYEKVDPNAAAESFVIPIYPDDPLIGDKKAPITIVAFEDFGCPACKIFSETFDSFEEKHPGMVKLIWKGLSVTSFPFSTKPAQLYGYCAAKQKKFDLFKAYAFTNSDSLSPENLAVIAEKIELNEKKLEKCLTSPEASTYLSKTETIAQILHIQQLPTLFYNNVQMETPQTIDQWERFLEAVRHSQQ